MLAVFIGIFASENSVCAAGGGDKVYVVPCPEVVAVSQGDGGSYTYSAKSQDVMFVGGVHVMPDANCRQEGKKSYCIVSPSAASLSSVESDIAECHYQIENKANSKSSALKMTGNLRSFYCTLAANNGSFGFKCPTGVLP